MRSTHQAIPLFKDVELNTLIDMLADLTATYTRMIAENAFSSESETCRLMILNLQDAIRIKQALLDDKKSTPAGGSSSG